MKNCEEHKNIESPKCPICLANELLLHFLIRDKLQEENEKLRQQIKELVDGLKKLKTDVDNGLFNS